MWSGKTIKTAIKDLNRFNWVAKELDGDVWLYRCEPYWQNNQWNELPSASYKIGRDEYPELELGKHIKLTDIAYSEANEKCNTCEYNNHPSNEIGLPCWMCCKDLECPDWEPIETK